MRSAQRHDVCLNQVFVQLVSSCSIHHIAIVRNQKKMYQSFIISSLILLTIVFGSVGNILVIYSLCKQKMLIKKNNHYYLVLHLAIYDLVCLLFGEENVYESFSGNNFAFLTLLCKLWPTIHTCFYIMDAAIMVIIALARYRAVFCPLTGPLKRRQINVALGVGWMLAIACVAPFFPIISLSSPAFCTLNWPSKTFQVAYTIFLAGIQYFIPVILLSVVYLRIYKKISKEFAKTPRRGMAPSDTEENIKKLTQFQRFRRDRNGRIFLTSFSIVICFAISAFPVQCIGMIRTSDIHYFSASYLLYLMGVSSINPFIYKALDKRVFLVLKSFVSRTFRRLSKFKFL